MLNRQLKEKLGELSRPTGVEEYKPRCDFAVNNFKEVIGSFDSEIEKIKGLINIDEEEGNSEAEKVAEMPLAGEDVEMPEGGKEVEVPETEEVEMSEAGNEVEMSEAGKVEKQQ